MSSALDNLRSRIASLYENPSGESLGKLALEILVKRNEARSELEHLPTLDKKHEIERRIDALHEIENAIVSLYMLQGIKSTKKPFNLSDITQTKYHLFSKKVIS